MKQKQGSNQLKRSLTISREHAEELMKGHYEVLLEYSDPFATECYGVLKTNCYIPKVIVEYKRMAFVFKENDTRITFDSNISASKLTGRFLEEYAGCFPVIHPGCVVMEVKYNNFPLHNRFWQKTYDGTEYNENAVCTGVDKLVLLDTEATESNYHDKHDG